MTDHKMNMQKTTDCPECLGIGEIRAENCSKCEGTGKIIIHSHPHSHGENEHDHPHPHSREHGMMENVPHEHRHQ